MSLKVIITAAVILILSASVIADGHKHSEIREAKSSNPMIALHLTANQAQADMALNSSMLCGNQFNIDEFFEMFPQ